MSTGNIIRIETGAEILKAMRAPQFIVPTLCFPVGFYLLFGIMLSNDKDSAGYLLGTYGIFAMIGPAIFGFGAGVASERERGWLALKRAAPVSALSYVTAKMITTLLFGAIAIATIYLVAGFVGGVALTRVQWALLLLVHLSSALPFSLIGLILGLSLTSNGAMAMSNIVFMLLAVLGGLWFPTTMFPAFLQQLAIVLPSYHAGEIALHVLGAPGEHPLMPHLAWLSVITAILALFTWFSWTKGRHG